MEGMMINDRFSYFCSPHTAALFSWFTVSYLWYQGVISTVWTIILNALAVSILHEMVCWWSIYIHIWTESLFFRPDQCWNPPSTCTIIITGAWLDSWLIFQESKVGARCHVCLYLGTQVQCQSMVSPPPHHAVICLLDGLLTNDGVSFIYLSIHACRWRRVYHLRHHQYAGQVVDVEERLIGLGMPWYSPKRWLVTLTPAATLLVSPSLANKKKVIPRPYDWSSPLWRTMYACTGC